MEEKISKFLVEGCRTKDSFIRDSLIEIYSSIDAPVSIDSIEFSDVYESTYQIMGQTADYEISYSAEIGYDRQEQYVAQKKEWDSNLGKHVMRNVIETRTVTDWQPYNGTVTKKGAAFMELTNDDKVDLGDLDEKVCGCYGDYGYEKSEVALNGDPAINPEKIAAIDFVEPTSYQSDYLLEKGAFGPTNEVKWEMPGDHNRNLRMTYKAQNIVPTVFAVKRFKSAFEFDGKTHFSKQFTTELLPQIFCSYRKKDDVLEDLKKNCDEEVKNDPVYKKNDDLGTYAGLGMFAGIVLVFLCMIISAIPPMLAFFGVIIAIISGILKFKVFDRKRNERKKMITDKFDQMQKDHKKDIQKQKVELLNARFAMMDWEPLTELELERFKLKNTHSLSTNYDENGYKESVEEEPVDEEDDDE